MLFLTASDGQTIILSPGTPHETKIHILCREDRNQIFTIGIDAPSTVEIVRSNARVKVKKTRKTGQVIEKAY